MVPIISNRVWCIPMVNISYSHIFPLEYIAPARRALLDALENGDERRALQVGSGAIGWEIEATLPGTGPLLFFPNFSVGLNIWLVVTMVNLWLIYG